MSLPRPYGRKIFNTDNSFASKCETVLKLKKGSIYYMQNLGSNLEFFLNSNEDFSIETLNNVILAQLVDNGVYVTDFESSTSKETLFTLDVEVSGNLGTTETGGTYNGNL